MYSTITSAPKVDRRRRYPRRRERRGRGAAARR
jgi:hypothetical protein